MAQKHSGVVVGHASSGEIAAVISIVDLAESDPFRLLEHELRAGPCGEFTRGSELAYSTRWQFLVHRLVRGSFETEFASVLCELFTQAPGVQSPEASTAHVLLPILCRVIAGLDLSPPYRRLAMIRLAGGLLEELLAMVPRIATLYREHKALLPEGTPGVPLQTAVADTVAATITNAYTLRIDKQAESLKSSGGLVCGNVVVWGDSD